MEAPSPTARSAEHTTHGPSPARRDELRLSHTSDSRHPGPANSGGAERFASDGRGGRGDRSPAAPPSRGQGPFGGGSARPKAVPGRGGRRDPVRTSAEMKGPRGWEMKEPPGPRRARTEVCNCDKYLKVSRERMKQLVEGSRQASGEHSTGCPGSQSCDAPVPARGTAQPSCALHGERPEGPGQRGAAAVRVGDTILQVAAIPPGVLDRAELTDFYCCTRCGKVFWEGSHFGRVVSQFQDVLVSSGDAQSIYELS